MKILYFDIDGVLLSYPYLKDNKPIEDEQRPLLLDGALEGRLKSLNFDKLACVSGHSDMVNASLNRLTLKEQKESIHYLLKNIFPDKNWFIDRLELLYNNDNRGKHINLKEDWFYLDDWADKFFIEAYGEEQYKEENNKRILLVDPFGDGSDILNWLDKQISIL